MDTANIPILLSARIPEILDRIPIREKSRTPWIRNPFQQSSLSVVLSGIGMGEYFPLIAGIIAIDPILDMGRTMLNVNGTLTTAVIVGKSFNHIDEDVYYGRKQVVTEE